MTHIFNVKDFGVIPNAENLQTEQIQAVLNQAGQDGGLVVFPAGRYRTGGLLLRSRTELHLESGATLIGSENPADYAVFPIPADVSTRTDMDMIPDYFIERKNVRIEYRRALISAYGEKDIAITGEGDSSIIDGRDCFDPEGEEQMRGPHGIFLSNCKGIRLLNYTIQNCGNFHHQMDANECVTISKITALGGHDGFHLHCCKNVDIGFCTLHTGDDCIAGMNMENIHVHNCDLNTSCQVFRISGNNILVENCNIWGPGVFPYRRSIVIDKDHILPMSEGHHGTNSLIEYFASETYPLPYSGDIVLKNCQIRNPGKLLYYDHTASTANRGCHFCKGTPLRDLSFENCTISGKCLPSQIFADCKLPLCVTLKNVTCSDDIPELFSADSMNITVVSDS